MHPERQQLWKELHHSLQKHAVSNNISTTIQNLLAHGLYLGRQAVMMYDPTIDHPEIRQLAHAQQQTGWNQMYNGRYSPQ